MKSMGEGPHRILSYQSYASGDNDRVHTLSFWNMRYSEECTTSQMLETFTFVYRKWMLKVPRLYFFYF